MILTLNQPAMAQERQEKSNDHKLIAEINWKKIESHQSNRAAPTVDVFMQSAIEMQFVFPEAYHTTLPWQERLEGQLNFPTSSLFLLLVEQKLFSNSTVEARRKKREWGCGIEMLTLGSASAICVRICLQKVAHESWRFNTNRCD